MKWSRHNLGNLFINSDMLSATYEPYQLQFKTPVLTSRGGMSVKNGFFIRISDSKNTGIGEVSFIEGLSRDDLQNVEAKIKSICENINVWENEKDLLYEQFPSLSFALETAFRDLKNGGKQIFFESDFTKGKQTIPINGLIWMGDKNYMRQQIEAKIQDGFRCIKIKVAAIDFEEECRLIAFIREHFPASKMEIRLDANGGFTAKDVFQKLERLAVFNIHSIEQPVKQKQWELMQKICAKKIIDVALDEELIYTISPDEKREILDFIRPKYIILKPSLIGGLAKSDEWISLAEERNIGWWATSALESNIGLNAIAQWVAAKPNVTAVQGLGTGGLYVNNIKSPLKVLGGQLHYKIQNG